MSKPRFIAGAVCPACGAIDRTVLELTVTARERRCVACGHREMQMRNAQDDASVPTPATRFDGARTASDVAPAAIIRVLPRSNVARESDPRE
jgi:hypothetical protein